MNTRRSRLLLICTTLLLAACGSGEGALIERSIAPSVHHVLVGVAGNLVIEASAAPYLTILADDAEALERLDVELDGDRVRIEQRAGDGMFSWLQNSGPVEIRMGVPALSHVEFAGNGEVEIRDAAGAELRVELAGSTECAISGVSVESLRIEIAGRGKCVASGRAQRQWIAISGAGDYEALELESRDARIALSGMGDARVNATDTLDASISGMGDVAYAGRPQITERISGWGSVESL